MDDLEHAREMRGASLSLEDCGHRPGIDADKGFARIDVLGLGSVNDLDADRLEKGQVGLKVARVGFVVFARPELQGVDEDRDDHIVRRLLRGPNERKVPFVKRAHRHDERARAFEGAEGFRKIRFSACNFSHAYQFTGRRRNLRSRGLSGRLTDRRSPHSPFNCNNPYPKNQGTNNPFNMTVLERRLNHRRTNGKS